MSSPSSISAIFLPQPLPRAGTLALWGEGISGPADVELILPTAKGVRERVVKARLLPIKEALPVLLEAEDKSPSLAAWSAATLAGLGILARGRLRPAVTEEGHGVWRIGPLDPADADLLHALAGAMPAEGYALPLPGSRPLRVHEPIELIRGLWDALADTLTRGGRKGAFARTSPTKVQGPLDWLQPDNTSRLVLRVTLPDSDVPDGEDLYRVGVCLRSVADPSLLIEAAELWAAPPAVAARFGPDPEKALLTGIRRGTRMWPPLGSVLGQAAPLPIKVNDEAIVQLLNIADRLANAEVEVLLPTELLSEPLTVKAVATPTPGSVTNPAFALKELLSFTWQPTLGGQSLTSEELAQLAEAKRPLIRLRGQWVRVDQEVLKRLRRKPSVLTGPAALAAALTESIDVDGEQVRFETTGSLLALKHRLAALPDVPVPEALQATLRPYQQRGLSWLAGMTDLGLGGCLADDMGLGKTIQVIALHLHRHRNTEDSGPTLVVCPTSLLGNWEREIMRFAPNIPVRRYYGGERHLDNIAANEMVLVTYGIVRNDAIQLAEVNWGLVVADEAQYVKNPLSRTARQLRTLPSTTRLALSGTPVENRLSELWALLDWTTPGLLGALKDFQHNVAVPVERYRDPHATERLARLIRPFLLRRRKSDPGIVPELPSKTETDRIVPLTAEQASLYKAVVAESLAEIDAQAGIARRGLVLKLLNTLKQICNHPAQYLKETGPLPGRSGKLTALDDLLEIILAEGDSVLVFSQYVQMCRLLEKHLTSRGVRTLLLSGQTRRRDQMVAEFQSGNTPVFLISLKAGGVGLNLTRATHVVHYDRWWNPAVEDQATDRAYRIGQDRPIQVHRLVTEGTVEDRIATLLTEKRTLAESIIGTGENWITELSTADLADLVRLGSA